MSFTASARFLLAHGLGKSSNNYRNKIVITGFNTDIEHDGVVYHVQTEDKGLDSPLILSLVYAGGAILASKRSPYEDLIATGFNEEALAERLKRQHRLICAAINAGRIEDLKRMGRRGEGTRAQSATPDAETKEPDIADVIATVAEAPTNAEILASNEVVGETTMEIPSRDAVAQDGAPPSDEAPKPAKKSAYTVYDSRRKSPLGEVVEKESRLTLTILNEQQFGAGQSVRIQVLVQKRSDNKEKPLEGVPLSVKILGTTFRPLIYSVKSERDGVAVVSAQIPRFTSGRAAILIRAVAEGHSTEVRRVIHPAI
ncbi:MAG TPA: hypothetical protein DCK93_07130 [Blastocatellia bacterium]|nr:hypothetical protein [Blastocatellia bacterium]HAF22675.1 hypothetical protein [Blastocatellia bacterium]